MLLATPFLHGIRESYPHASIHIGVGDWAKELLLNNPDVDEIVTCNAPWHNKQICEFPANSIKTYLAGLKYVLLSDEVRHLKKNKYIHGVDYLGSRQGSWLLKRIGIPIRYGVKGYAGGHNWCTKSVDFKIDEHVSKAGIKFLKIMDPHSKLRLDPRPRIFLTEKEIESAFQNWNFSNNQSCKIVIAPGAGFPEKSWGDNSYQKLVRLILDKTKSKIAVIGSLKDAIRIKMSDKRLVNFCGRLSLRESAAIVSKSDLVISNSSVAMHLAGAFSVPAVITLGQCYDSTRLHNKQWGYPENTILGKEVSKEIKNIATVDAVYAQVESMLDSKESS